MILIAILMPDVLGNTVTAQEYIATSQIKSP